MKPTLLFPAVLAACAAVLTFHPGLVRADDDMALRRTEAEALLHAMHTDQILANSTARVDEMVDKYTQTASAQAGITPEQKAAAQKARADAHALIHQQLGWDAVKNDFIQLYAEAFTEVDLKDLVAFYSSPLGQKLVEKQPAVTEKMGKLTQQKMMAVMPAAMQKIRATTQKPPTAASPATGSLVSPAPAPTAPAMPAPAAISPTH